MRRGAGVLGVLVGTAFASALLLTASARSQGTEGVKFVDRLPTAGAIGIRSWTVEAESRNGESVSLSSLTPSVCTLSEEPTHSARQGFASAELRSIAVGTCTILAQSGMAEAKDSFPVFSPWSKPVGNNPEIFWAPPAKAIVGGEEIIELGARAHAGARLASTTPDVCTLTPIMAEEPAEAAAKVRFNAVGTCAIMLLVAGSNETKTAEERKTFPVIVHEAPPKKGVPTKVRPTLLKVALQWAAKRGDPQPYDIQAVRAREATPSFVIPRHPREKWVYVVAMRGEFRPGQRCPKYKGGPPPPGRECHEPVAVVYILASTLEGLYIAQPGSYPDLEALGAPVAL